MSVLSGNPAPGIGTLLDVAKGNVPGHSAVLIRGHNPSQTAASGFVDVSEFGNITYLSAAETMDLVSTDANDADPSGTGLRTVLVQGVDGTGAAVQEVVPLNGLTPVTTVNAYLRVNFIIGLTAGSVGWNIGTVTATASTAATLQCQMNPVQAISHNAHYTVPLGKTLYVQQAEFNVAKEGGGGLPVVDFVAQVRIGGEGAAWVQVFDKKIDAAVSNDLDLFLANPNGLPTERSDIRFRADTDTNNTETRVRLYGLLVDN
jgi:hypothetical protein